MPSSEDYKGQTPAWCPGCGNFGILKAFKETMAEMGLAPHQFVIISGIGQAGKFPHYLKCNTFNGLHGRTLPVATAFKLVNNKMTVIAVAGDGDCYGEGGNHLIHAMRRNPNVKLFVHNNQVYGLTKGQASPTTQEGTVTKNAPLGVLSEQMNPMALAVAMDCSFAGRSYAGDQEHLKMMIRAAIEHKGFSLVDILQPCVSFNKVNTYEWYKQRVYRLGDGYNSFDRIKAFEKSLEWGDRIPIGVIYRRSRPVLDEQIPFTEDISLVNQPFDPMIVSKLIKEFY